MNLAIILLFGIPILTFLVGYAFKMKRLERQLEEKYKMGFGILVAKSFYEHRNGLAKNLIQDFLKSDLSLLNSQLELLHQAYKQDNPDSKVICYYYIGTLKDLSIQLNDKLSNKGLDGEEWRLIYLK